MSRPATLPTNRPRPGGVGEQPRKRLVALPLGGGSNALGLVAWAAGGDEVAGRRPSSSAPREDMVDLGRLAAAVSTGPAVPVQNGTAQQRVDSTLGGIPGGGIPMQEWIGEIGSHSLSCSPRRRSALPGNPSERKVALLSQLLSNPPLLEVLGDGGQLGQRHPEADRDPPRRCPAWIALAFLQPGDLARVEPDAARKRALCQPLLSSDFPHSPGEVPLWFPATGHPGS